MQAFIMWMLAIYGLSVVCIQCWKWLLHHPQAHRKSHFFVYTHNSQGQIEWAIRSLTEMARLEGREYLLYVIDQDSSDDTLLIIDRLVKTGHAILLLSEQEAVELREKDIELGEQQFTVDIRERCFACAYKTG